MAQAIKLKRGMILDLDLDPTKGSETGKTRPCIIVTNNIYNERVPVIQVVPITSSLGLAKNPKLKLTWK